MDLEQQFKAAVIRAYETAGLRLLDHQAQSLAQVYADWAADAGDGVVDRVERALAASLGTSA